MASGKHHVAGIIAALMMLASAATAFAQDEKQSPPPPEPAQATNLQSDWPQVAQTVCCKTCRKGKACGNSCISRDKTCTRPPGCACNAQ